MFVYVCVCMYACMYECMYVCMYVCACGVLVSMLDFHRSDQGSNPGRNYHNEHHNTIMRHHWQVSKNHMPRVHPSHVREIGKMETVQKPSVAELAGVLEIEWHAIMYVFFVVFYTFYASSRDDGNLRHTTLNTEQNQLSSKVSADN